ncbi:uncharacterized protein K02A2.6-like [Rhipicephalus sanguineus]|uniref:uncharacterized protein K02A2.6-like n=1 Tax=Rhipicephalus sanguineus TaxID=34632 RepID=UPI0020C54EA6|nr:uncharacterized protein K02A2.6-like [Rhipicephalus sanguineus]
MVTVVKGDKVRICLDPTSLNQAILRENYPMPTLDDVAPRLAGAKFFSTLDAASGFWQIRLSESSSKRCTMSTPYGRYRFLRMPFGIASAPEIFRAAMHRVLEGLSGVAVVMDDILVWGRTKDEHDRSLKLVLSRCQQHNLRLNTKKSAFLQPEVRYLGHILTTEGLRLDSERVQDILGMPEPTNASEARLKSILAATNNDAVLSKLREYALTSWPDNKHEVPEAIRPYWSYQEEIHTQDGLLFRSNKVIIPSSMKAEILALLHVAHPGADKMKARARSVIFWPCLASDIEQFCRNCKMCQKHQPRNAKMPLLSHEIPNLPWEAVGMDLFFYGGRQFAIIVDFYSFFFEIKEFRHTTANQLKSWCTELFSVHGLPLKLCSDNGPPFNSTEFKDFLYRLGIPPVTSSPYHPRSNGMTERAVQEAKKLLKKCSLKTPDFHKALLEWRNTPRDSILKSPVQRLMGRQTRTLLPVPASHLVPETVPNRAVHNRLQEIRQRQRIYYNRRSRNLPPLSPGQRVTTYDTHERTWTPAVFLRPAETPRSVVVKTEEGQEIRRTREHLRDAPTHTEESPRDGSERLEDAQPAQELRRSTRTRREPSRYPQPERAV